MKATSPIHKAVANRLKKSAHQLAKEASEGKDIGKKGKNFSKIAGKAAEEYGSAEAGKRVAGAVMNKLYRKR